jgi:hypothetical protein
MKKILLSILSIGLFATAFGQSEEGGGLGIEFGFRGDAASDWLFNSNVSGGATQTYAAAFSYNYGVHFAFDVNQHIGIEVNLLLGAETMGYSGKFGSGEDIPQERLLLTDRWSGSPFAESIQPGESYTSTSQMNVMEIPLLFRYGSGNGAYVEIGAAYQIINSVQYSVNYTNGPAVGTINYTNTDVSPAFAKSNILGILGFGDDFQIGSSPFNIITNLRFYYGFSDVGGVDAHGQYLATTLPDGTANDYLYKNAYGGTGAPFYANYKPTHFAGASFSIGLYYYIGFVKSNGGRHACKHTPKAKG